MEDEQSMFDKLICNAVIVSHTGRVNGSIGIQNGKIAMISGNDYLPEAREVIDVGGKYVIPGVIDAHVHFQDPGLTRREDFEHGTAAAAVGGVTTAISHPLNVPPAVDLESYQFTVDAYAGRGYIDYGVHGGGTAGNIDVIEELWNQTGATSVKMFMCFSVADFPYVRDDSMVQILRKLAKVGGLAIIHAENNELISMEEERLKKEGRTDRMCHIESHSALGELEAVRRALFYLEQTGASAVILHTCMVESLREIRAAQQRGVKVYAECCPHLLTFIDTDMKEYGPWLKFTPVMRGEENRQQLWELLNEGYVSTMGSDHSPYEISEKEAGLDDIWKAPNGIPGIQTMLPVLLNGVTSGRLSLERLVEITSFNPARIYGLDYCKGSLEVGKDADLVILDLEQERKFTLEEIKSKSKWSPYVGMTFKGWPVMTFVRGELVAKGGEVIGKLGYGNYIPRKK